MPLSYAGLFDQVTRTVDALNRAGYGRGDRIALALPPGPETATAVISVLAGCVFIPLNPAMSSPELRTLLPRFRIQALLTRTGLLPHLVEAAAECRIPAIHLEPLVNEPAGRFSLTLAPREPNPLTGFSTEDELSAVFPTSGTTDLPKRIPWSQAEVCGHALRSAENLKLTPSDRCLHLMPVLHHCPVMSSILSTMFAGASGIHPTSLSALDFMAWVRALQPTWCAVPPPFFQVLLSEIQRHGGPSPNLGLRALYTCGAPLNVAILTEVERTFGAPVRNSYGASECGSICANPMPPGLRKPASVGVALGLDVRIVDASGEPLPVHQPGEVVVRGPGVFRGYEEDPDNNLHTFFGEWFRTGDQGYFDSDGYLFLLGRTKELINRGGEKIAPQEIDAVLQAHPNVQEAAAFPIPHPVLGEDVAAAVVLKHPDLGLDPVRQFASEQLAGFKVPRTLLAVSEIPKGPAGKVQRNRLAGLFAPELALAQQRRLLAAGSSPGPLGNVESSLLEIWQSVLGRPDIGVCDDFFDLGGHSLQAAILVSKVEELFGRKLPVSVLLQEPTIQRLARFLSSTEPQRLAVRHNGSKPPVFILNPQLSMRLLAHRIELNQPALYLELSEKWAAANPRTLAEIAACLVTDMLDVQPAPPYFLLGWGCSGTLAYEIAQQLLAAGKPAELLLLIDTLNLDRVRTARFWRERILTHGSRLAKLPRSGRPAYVAAKLRSLVTNIQVITAPRRYARKPGDPARLVPEAVPAYVPMPYPGRVVHFRSNQYADVSDRSLGWKQLAPRLEVVDIPGDASSLFQPPQVDTLAARMTGFLNPS